MHPDTYSSQRTSTARSIGGAPATRAHILTCAACSARLERLRGDARRIATFAAGPAPDVRAAVRARLRRKGPAVWLARGGALAGALAALLLFALLIGISGGTVGRVSDRCLFVDRQTGQLIELDASSGQRLRQVVVGDQPTKVRFDRQLDRAYVVLAQAIVAVDMRTLAVVDRGMPPSPFRPNAGIALDERRGRLYVAQPEGVIALDAATLAQIPVSTSTALLAHWPYRQIEHAVHDRPAGRHALDDRMAGGAAMACRRDAAERASRAGWR